MHIDYFSSLFQTALAYDGVTDGERLKELPFENVRGKYSELHLQPLSNRIFHFTGELGEVDAIIQHYKRVDRLEEFWWYVFPNSTQGLAIRLEEKGFDKFATVEALHLESLDNFVYSEAKNHEISIREIPSQQLPKVINQIFDLNWNDETIDHRQLLRNSRYYPVVRNFMAYLSAEPVALSLLMSLPDTEYIYLFASTVAEKYRRKGVYTALLEHRIQIARDENKKIITMANVETSSPILLSKGFSKLGFSVDLYKLKW